MYIRLGCHNLLFNQSLYGTHHHIQIVQQLQVCTYKIDIIYHLLSTLPIVQLSNYYEHSDHWRQTFVFYLPCCLDQLTEISTFSCIHWTKFVVCIQVRHKAT